MPEGEIVKIVTELERKGSPIEIEDAIAKALHILSQIMRRGVRELDTTLPYIDTISLKFEGINRSQMFCIITLAVIMQAGCIQHKTTVNFRVYTETEMCYPVDDWGNLQKPLNPNTF